jgi:ubiquinone/menaquinone biosynthesis C-methylase UbiE
MSGLSGVLPRLTRMTDPEQVAVWDAEAQAYDEPPDHGLRDLAVRAAWRDLLLRLLPGPPAHVADLGCGTGTLSVLLADEGFEVVGVDFSPEMLSRAAVKGAGRTGVEFVPGDAAAPPLEAAAYDVVLCRHVLWALPEPAAVLRRWTDLLRPGGRLVLIEGSWSTGAGLTAEQTMALVRATGREPVLTRLDDETYWGRTTGDERYVVVS